MCPRNHGELPLTLSRHAEGMVLGMEIALFIVNSPELGDLPVNALNINLTA
ncbi:MAG: hypothetical protein ACLUVZ_15985 [Bacteroides stercoris]